MAFLHKLNFFANDESGAVTVDWVVLTSSIVLLGAIAVSIYLPGLMGAATEIGGAVDGVLT